MTIKQILRSDDIQRVESEIIDVLNGTGIRYRNADSSNFDCLLEIRKDFINKRVLKYQKELIPEIIAFNEALRNALQKMYDKAHRTWNNVLKSHETEDEDAIELTAKCYLSPVYPKKHLLQGVDRQDLWYALCNDNLNTLYADGVSLQTLTLPRDDKESFDSFIGMDCPPPNWNEGLDSKLTEGLHLICQFNHLFDHTYWAITDFIYVPQFGISNTSFSSKKVSIKAEKEDCFLYIYC